MPVKPTATILRIVLPILIICLLPVFACSQNFYTGRITNDIEQPLPGVSIRLARTGKLYQTDSNGTYRIPTVKKEDTIICKLAGFDSARAFVQTGTTTTLMMWPVIAPQKKPALFLSSLTRNLIKDPVFIRQLYGETYRTLVENGFVEAKKFPATGFSLNVNKASYSNIRRFINGQTIMPSAAVRIEEMLNYFSLGCTRPPTGKEVFSMETRTSTCPWNVESVLLYISIQARKISLEHVPPGNLVFLIDDSGSMDMPNRLPLLQSAFKMLANNLRATDTVAIVTYGGTAQIWLLPTGGADKQKIIESIESLRPGGSTPGASGVKLAYQMAEKMYNPGANNRVILATDGDFNIGITNEKELENFIVKYRNSGIYLTCLGVGMGNYKDSKLETLARYGNGNFAYLDNEREAEKVLVKEFAQTAVTVANDVALHIDFDPALVKEYRLIGFDNTQQALADTGSILEGGEIGSGHSLMAMFEVKPVFKIDIDDNQPNLLLGNLKLQYRQPGKRTLEWKSQGIPVNLLPFEHTDTALKFATSVVMLGQLLRQSPFSKAYNFDAVLTIASGAAAPDNIMQQEFIKLVQDAKKVYKSLDGKKKRRND